jgi:hypothetical protein
MIESRVRKVINSLIEFYKHNPNRWKNERFAHYDFFGLLFEEFTPEEIRDRFKWEYPVGIPSYGRGKKPAAVDCVIANDEGKWVAVEIELVGAGKALRTELSKCIEKLKSSPECQKYMSKGYIVPLLARKGEKQARGYGTTYSDLCRKDIYNAEGEIGGAPIEIIRGGVLLS